MSNETHDQNKGLETPDTAPSRGRVILLAVIIYALAACAGYFFIFQVGDAVNLDILTEPTPTLSFNADVDPVAYIVPAANPLFTRQQIALANMQTAETTVELATILGTYPEIEVIYIDPAVAYEFDADYLRDQLDLGRTIVGVKVEHDAFVTHLGLDPTVNNLSEDLKPQVLLWVSIIYEETDTTGQSVRGFDDFQSMLSMAGRIR